MNETHLLRITQNRVGPDSFSVEVSYEAPGAARQAATSKVKFQLTDQEYEQIRWYLEDYLQFPQDPAPTIAGRVEERMAEIGKELFKAIFHSSDDARDLWATLRTKLNDTRVEVITSVEDAAAIPWELVRDPKTDACLALNAVSFVRAHSQSAQAPKLPSLSSEEEAIRILLVICRPGKGDDVPFRSVATRLIKGLTAETYQQYQLDMLRPATYSRLAEVLRRAKADGKPYHIVHFDGHGCYEDLHAIYTGQMARNPRGYLLFENPVSLNNFEYIHGKMLGELLFETGVSLLVLNACRSAHADPKQAPESSSDESTENPHAKVRALGSLAQEVMEAGVAGIVAMRYNVYVVTAAHFVADLYGTLVQGHTFGEAVTMGRKQLADDPLREIAFEPRPLRDWCVPIVYEAAPIRLFTPKADKDKAKLIIDTGKSKTEVKSMDPALPKRPDAGFYGRDETLLALDRAFDSQPIILLHALAGSGKTATAAEFARWYVLTGGLGGGPVLFTSFEHYTPLRSVLGHFGQMFGAFLEQLGINWSAITDTNEMKDIALEVMEQIPILWIWDNVEPVAGFPKGADSAWETEEQKELVDFLRDARETKARFLLTSRRDEQDWLGDVPTKITVPPMPLQERVQLTRALADKHGHKITDIEDWRPLLKFTRGNPLTITVLVDQALRDKLRSKKDIENFVEKLRAGEARFEDEKAEGRSKSLGASLSYGFEHAFSEDEQKILALLHFFQGFVDVDVLDTMGSEKVDWSLPELRDKDRDELIGLLDRAGEIGLLTAHGEGYYIIHPALPWFFMDLFDRYYTERKLEATRCFVEDMGDFGNYCNREYDSGSRDIIMLIQAEEANLLYARRLARTHGWWGVVINTMLALYSLYDHTGRRAEWRQLVEEIVPDFVDPATDGPVQGREDVFPIVVSYQVSLAREERNWSEAERLLKKCIDLDRKRASILFKQEPSSRSKSERHAIRTLSADLHQLAEIQREQGSSECVVNYEESLTLAEHIGERTGAAACAFNLGNAYRSIESIRDLVKAEEWYHRSLELHNEQDHLGRLKVIDHIGLVNVASFHEAKASGASKEELFKFANKAVRAFEQSIDLAPPDAINALGISHQHLGAFYGEIGHIERSFTHSQQAIRYFEVEQNLFEAARTRYSVAMVLINAGRLEDALEYAQAALSNFESFGERAADEIEKIQRFIVEIQDEMKKGGNA